MDPGRGRLDFRCQLVRRAAGNEPRKDHRERLAVERFRELVKRVDRRPRGWTLERDPYLFETSVPGIFAAGDVRGGSGKRVAAAVGEGSGTVSMIHRYLETV